MIEKTFSDILNSSEPMLFYVVPFGPEKRPIPNPSHAIDLGKVEEKEFWRRNRIRHRWAMRKQKREKAARVEQMRANFARTGDTGSPYMSDAQMADELVKRLLRGIADDKERQYQNREAAVRSYARENELDFAQCNSSYAANR